jgi:hypothetical protein
MFLYCVYCLLKNIFTVTFFFFLLFTQIVVDHSVFFAPCNTDGVDGTVNNYEWGALGELDALWNYQGWSIATFFFGQTFVVVGLKRMFFDLTSYRWSGRGRQEAIYAQRSLFDSKRMKIIT